eukprot:RCo045804
MFSLWTSQPAPSMAPPSSIPSAKILELQASFEAYKDHARELHFWKDRWACVVPKNILKQLEAREKEFLLLVSQLSSEKDQEDAVEYRRAFNMLKFPVDALVDELSQRHSRWLSPEGAAELDREQRELQAQEQHLLDIDPVRALQPVKDHVNSMMQKFAMVQGVTNALLVEEREKLDGAEHTVEGAEARVSDGVHLLQDALVSKFGLEKWKFIGRGAALGGLCVGALPAAF